MIFSVLYQICVFKTASKTTNIVSHWLSVRLANNSEKTVKLTINIFRHMQSTIDINKLKRGDSDTYRDLFVLFYPRLMALACRFVDKESAEDIVQEVFTSLWEQKKTMQNVNNIQSFLYKCVQNNCLNYIKHQSVTEEYHAWLRISEARINYLNSLTNTNEILKEINYKELHEIIMDAVRKLPPKCAQAFKLCYFHEMSHREIAEVMDISPRTVEGHIRQAALFLRTELKDILMLIFVFYNMN